MDMGLGMDDFGGYGDFGEDVEAVPFKESEEELASIPVEAGTNLKGFM